MPCWEPKRPESLSALSAGIGESREHQPAVADCCDYCGSRRIIWRKCKLICEECRQINKSCADL